MVYDNASVQRKNRKDIKDTTPTDLLVGMTEYYNHNYHRIILNEPYKFFQNLCVCCSVL